MNIYILLMHTYTIPSKLIKCFTRYEYSHVGISLQKDCKEIYSFGRKNINNFLISGFNIETKEGAFFQKFQKTKCIIYEVKVTPKQYYKIKKRIKYMISHEEKFKYDFAGMITRFFGIPSARKNYFVCSFFVASLLSDAGVYDFKKPSCMVKPKDFANIKEFPIIYKGKYVLYE